MRLRSVGARLRDYGERVFGLDLRAVAAFRIALGLTLLGYTLSASLDYSLLLTGRGVLPASALWPPESIPLVEPATFFAVVDAPAFVLALLTAMAAAAALLALGLFSRSAALCLWLGTSFLVRRNPWTGNAADTMLLFSLLWALFLPLGARWSIDRARGRAPARLPLRVLSPATAGLVVQIFFVYLTAALAKSGPEWHADASAVWMVTQVERFQTPLTPLLAALPAPALGALTRGVWHLEALAPLLLVSPVFTAPLRTAAVMLLMAMHLGLGVFMRLGVFPWVCLAYLIALLPRPFWDRVAPEPASGVAPRAPGGVRRAALHAAAALLLVATVTSYARYVPGLEGRNPVFLRRIAASLRIGHTYRLFSRVSGNSSRFLVLGRRADGTLEDLLAAAPARHGWRRARPSVAPDGSDRFPWINYSAALTTPRGTLETQMRHYAGYFCRVDRGAARLERVELYHVLRLMRPRRPGTPTSRIYALDCPPPPRSSDRSPRAM